MTGQYFPCRYWNIPEGEWCEAAGGFVHCQGDRNSCEHPIAATDLDSLIDGLLNADPSLFDKNYGRI